MATRRGLVGLIIGFVFGAATVSVSEWNGLIDLERMGAEARAADEETTWETRVGRDCVDGYSWVDGASVMRVWIFEDHSIEQLQLYHEYDELEDSAIWASDRSDIPEYGGTVDVPIENELSDTQYPTRWFRIIGARGSMLSGEVVASFNFELPDNLGDRLGIPE